MNDNPSAAVHKSSTAALTLLALGVVYGDIGTSPLYAIKETFSPAHGIPLDTETILGGLSAIFWSLMIVVSLKYVVLVLRADNRGEGGTMALLALASKALKEENRARPWIILLGLFGGSLFFGEAILTPAISVLSAVEGIGVGTHALDPYVIPIAIVVIVALFACQRHGTAVIGTFFGPVCVIWFLILASGGLYNIWLNPAVLHAVNPIHALTFITAHGFTSFVMLGAILLAVTGVEALYADMGHFGRRPIRIAWFGMVLPSLVLNYFGQGALLIAHPEAISHPFYHAYPDWALFPMVGLATAATVIASQATISGIYSLARQAVQLGYLPRLDVQHTSEREMGQVYLPGLNWLLLALVLAAVLGFGSSSNLASAYGVSVAGAMLVTTCLTFIVIRSWKINLSLAIAATCFFLVVDLAFFSSSLVKVPEGGWFPLLTAAVMFTVMATWRTGRRLLHTQMGLSSIPLEGFLESLFRHPPTRVPGTAVFLTSAPDAVPHALMHNLAHNKVLHQRVLFLTVVIQDVPRVSEQKRNILESLGNECYRLTCYFGFKEPPDVMAALALCQPGDREFNVLETSFFLSRETVIPNIHQKGMMMWRERLFATMARNAGSAAEYFGIPTNRVVELGTQIEI